jgi:cell division protease FtsH
LTAAVPESGVPPQPQIDFQEEIRQIQQQLKQAGFDPGPADGVLGPRTMKALHRYLALANVINESALLAARYGKTVVTMDDLDEAIDRILAGPQRKSRVIAPKEKNRVAYHESSHALVAEMLPTADPVRKVTIIPHGVATLGYTQQLPMQDRYLYTQAELLDRITVLLGGRRKC